MGFVVSRAGERELARRAGKKRYFTGKPCPRGHMSDRLVSNWTCIKCLHEKGAALEKSTPERRKKANKRTAKYWKSTPERRAKRNRKENMRQKHHPILRIGRDLRIRISHLIDGTLRGGSAVRDLGCSLSEFKEYISSKFQPGMTWENRGKDTWHLDHIRPLASFDLTKREDFLQACHYTNYQPLWAKDNVAKGATWCSP